MGSEQQIAFHERSFRDSHDCWQSAERRATLEMSEGEAAYSSLEHAALWGRVTTLARVASLERPSLSESASNGEETPFAILARLDDKTQLIRAACAFAATFTLPDHFSRILTTDLPEPEEIEEIEQALSQIDGLDAVVDLSATLTASALDQDHNILTDLARSRSLVAAMVHQLSQRPDLVAVASRFLLSQRQPRHLDDGRPADWFTRMRELDRGYAEPSLGEFARRPLSAADGANSVVYFPLLGPAISAYDARSPVLGMSAAAACVFNSPITKTQAELTRREFDIEGDSALFVRLKLLLQPTRSRPMLEVLLEAREDSSQDAISAYESFEVFVPGLPYPMRKRFDFDVNTVELDDQALEALRVGGGEVGVILVTTSGQRRPIRPR